MRKRKTEVIRDLAMVGFANAGKSFGRTEEGKIVFVPLAVPGDIVDVQLRRNRKKFAEGHVTHYKKLSKDRIDPFCEHFGVCGGCKWQMLPYKQQLTYKQQEVTEVLKRIGKVNEFKTHPMIPAPKDRFYRNKLEYSFSSKRWLTPDQIADQTMTFNRNALGFHVPGRFDKVVQIETCYLQSTESNDIRNSLYTYCNEEEISFYDPIKQIGVMRNLVIRHTSVGEIMVIVVVKEACEEVAGAMDFLRKKFPYITSLFYAVNDKLNDSLSDIPFHLHSGQEYVTEQMGELQFRIGVHTFYQTNSLQAHAMYKRIAHFANIQKTETVYDLYTGAGTIANFLASKAKKVIGIEYVEGAVKDAKENSTINNIENTAFFSGDLHKVLTDDFIKTHGKPDTVITDPPRSGMHEKVIRMLLKVKPKLIIYVSCNPATQARDIEMLQSHYQMEEAQAIDLFPQTYHVENIAVLSLKN